MGKEERDQTLDNKYEIVTLDLSVILGARLRCLAHAECNLLRSRWCFWFIISFKNKK